SSVANPASFREVQASVLDLTLYKSNRVNIKITRTHIPSGATTIAEILKEPVSLLASKKYTNAPGTYSLGNFQNLVNPYVVQSRTGGGGSSSRDSLNILGGGGGGEICDSDPSDGQSP